MKSYNEVMATEEEKGQIINEWIMDNVYELIGGGIFVGIVLGVCKLVGMI